MGCIVIQPTSTLEQNIMTVKIIECYKLTMTRSKNESNRVSYLPDEGRGHCLLDEPCKHRLDVGSNRYAFALDIEDSHFG